MSANEDGRHDETRVRPAAEGEPWEADVAESDSEDIQPIDIRARQRRLVACGLGVALVVACGLGAAAWAMRPATQPADDGPVAEEPVRQDASVPAIISGLSYHGRDVSMPSGAVTVTAADGHVMVEERSDADAVTRVDLSARRSAALAHALDGQTVRGEGVSDVTWVACDPDGAVKAAVKNATTSESAAGADAEEDGAAASTDSAADKKDGAAAPSEPTTAEGGRDESSDGASAGTSGTEDSGSDASDGSGAADQEPTTSEVVSGSTGWTMSDDTKDGLSDAAPDLPASGGEAPTTPDGTEIVPEQPAPAEPSEEVPAEGDGGGEPASGDSGQASQPASGSSSGSSGSSASAPSAVAGGGSQGSGSSGSSSSSTPSTPAHQHDWQAVYGSRWVQDSAAWDETVVVSAAWDETVPVYGSVKKIRCSCGAIFNNYIDWESHCDDIHDGEASYSHVSQTVQTGTTTKHHDAVTKTVHHEATGHNESYVTGYRCSGCGASK